MDNPEEVELILNTNIRNFWSYEFYEPLTGKTSILYKDGTALQGEMFSSFKFDKIYSQGEREHETN